MSADSSFRFAPFGMTPCLIGDERGNRRLRRRFPLPLVFQTPVIPNGAKRNEESVEMRSHVKIQTNF